MQIKINGEQPFQTIGNGFGASPSNEDTVLQYSADGYEYTDWEDGEIPAGKTIMVTNCFSRCLYFRFKNNNTELTINM